MNFKEYNFKEDKDFNGLMPKITEKIGGIGQSNISTHLYCNCIKGDESLETIDINHIWESNENDIVTEPDFNNDYVELYNDYQPEETIIIGNGKNITVNLNNNKITAPIFSESEESTDSYGFWVKENANLIIEGDGIVESQDATYSMAVWANGGNVTIKGGKFYNHGDSCDLIYASAGGNVIIEGGEFFPAGPASGDVPGTKNAYTALNVKDKDYKEGISNIIVKGGKFYNFNPANNVSETTTPPTNFVAEGYKSVEIESNVWEVIPE